MLLRRLYLRKYEYTKFQVNYTIKIGLNST